jgi:hypothetical protein
MMNYATGESVKLGDRVDLCNSSGIVVCVIDTGEYCTAYPESQWNYLKRGVLIDFVMYGLLYYKEMIESDVKLIARSSCRLG